MEPRKQVCPLCGEGVLEVRYDRVHHFLAGRQRHTVTGLEHSVCSVCETSLCSADQVDRNVSSIEQYQSALPNFISPEKIAELRARYDISQAVASRIFGGGANAFSKYERGENSPSAAAASIMLLALQSPVIFRALARIKGVDVPSLETVHVNSVESQNLRVVRHCEISSSGSQDYFGCLDYSILESGSTHVSGLVEVFHQKDERRHHSQIYVVRKSGTQPRSRAPVPARKGYVGQQGFDKTSGKKWHATTH